MEELIKHALQPIPVLEMVVQWSLELVFLFRICSLFSFIQQEFMELDVWWQKDAEVKEVSWETVWVKDLWQDTLLLLRIWLREMWSADQWQCKSLKEEVLVQKKITFTCTWITWIRKFFTKDCQVSQKQQKFLPTLMLLKNQLQLFQQFTIIWEVFQLTTKHKSQNLKTGNRLLSLDWWLVEKLQWLQSMVLIDWELTHCWIWLFSAEQQP